jgi:uncharacterized membrane protein
MSNNEPAAVYKIVAFIFAGSKKALGINDEVKAADRYEVYRVVAHAVVEVDDKGKSHIHEAGHGVLGGGIGLVVGGLLGLFGGPAGLLLFAIAGTAIGGWAGQHAGRPIPTEDIERLSAQMQPDSSAVLALVEQTQVEALVAGMAGYEARVIILAVSDEVSGEIYRATAIPGESPALEQTAPGEIHYAAALPGQTSSHSAAPTAAEHQELPATKPPDATLNT